MKLPNCFFCHKPGTTIFRVEKANWTIIACSTCAETVNFLLQNEGVISEQG